MPRPSVAPIAAALKAARLSRNLTQRELGEKTGTSQGHISTIEAGRVDLTTASLIELARALDLELLLVPRSLVPALRGLIHATEAAGNRKGTGQLSAATAPDVPVPPAYSLDDEDEDDGDEDGENLESR